MCYVVIRQNSKYLTLLSRNRSRALCELSCNRIINNSKMIFVFLITLIVLIRFFQLYTLKQRSRPVKRVASG